MRNDNLQFPRSRGSDPHMGGGQTVSAYTVGINHFVGNEAYAVPNGLTIWWECAFGDFPRDNCSVEVDSFHVWHHHRWGYFGYPTNNITLRDFVERGDPSVLGNRFEENIGMNFSDYMTRNANIINADIQNVRTAIQMPSMRGARSETGPDAGITTIEDSYLVATVGLDVVVPASVNGAANLPPQTSVVRNVQFDSIDPSGQLNTAHILFNDSTFFQRNTSLRNDVRVYNYNSAPGATGDDLYLVPGYAPQGPGRCDATIGQCETELTTNFADISQGHVYPLGASQVSFPPVAQAGPDQSVEEGTAVSLDASASVDPGGSIVSYLWTENGVEVGSGVNPVLSDLTVGVHVIELLVTDNVGETATDTVEVTVNQVANIAPIADAGADQTRPQGVDVVLDGSRSADSDGSISSYQWAENGIEIGTGVSPVLSGLAAGVYVIELTVTDDNDATATDTVEVTIISGAAPIANAGADQTVQQGEDVVLDASGSADSDGSIVSYLWTENGVEVGTGVTLVVGGLAVGDYTYQLLVTDDTGATATDAIAISVSAAQLVAINDSGTLEGSGSVTISVFDNDIGVTADADIETNVDQQAQRGFLSVDQDADTITYTPYAGDPGTGTDSFGYRFRRAGTGLSNIAIVTITFAPEMNVLPIADAGPDQTVDEGADVTLDGSSSEDTDGSIASYVWSEDGVEVGTGVSPVLSDLAAGTHTIDLVVTDDEGETATDSVEITVNAIANVLPIADAGPDQTVEEGADVTLDGGNSEDTDGSIASYVWSENGVEVGTGVSPVLSDLAVGIHTIDLTVTDDEGETATDSVEITVNAVANVLPIADAGADQTVDEGADVTLDGGNSEDTDGSIASYVWSEDGVEVGTGVSPVLSDLAVGIHTIDLTVTDDEGETATDSVEITVNAIANVLPIADAGPDQTIDEGVDVTLDGGNSEDTDGSIASYVWSENGVEVGTEASPVLSGLTVGTHTIELVVTDDDDETATDSVEITVNAVANVLPIADAGPDQTVEEGAGVTLDGSNSEDADGSIASYVWSENGVEVGTGVSPVLSDLAVGIHTIDLTVTDDEGETATDSVEITVNAVANVLPIADAGLDQTIDEGADVTLDGGNSEDTDGSIGSYVWSEDGVEVGTGVSPVLSNLAVGTYIIELTVTDNLGATGVDSLSVTVNQANPCVPAGSANLTVSMLLIGNNLMNDVDSKLEQLLVCGGYTSDIDTYNPDGYSLADHDADTQTEANIAQGYDLTLLQELGAGFLMPELNHVPPYETISSLDVKISSAFSEMGFYQTWGLENRDIQETETILSSYETVADFFDAPIVHIGRAWDYFYTLHSETPPFSLYLDSTQPTEEGKALIAYVLYAYVTGETPLLTLTLGLDQTDAELLQNVAWDTYQASGQQFLPITK